MEQPLVCWLAAEGLALEGPALEGPALEDPVLEDPTSDDQSEQNGAWLRTHPHDYDTAAIHDVPQNTEYLRLHNVHFLRFTRLPTTALLLLLSLPLYPYRSPPVSPSVPYTALPLLSLLCTPYRSPPPPPLSLCTPYRSPPPVSPSVLYTALLLLSLPLYPVPLSSSCSLSLCTPYRSPPPLSPSVPRTALLLLLSLSLCTPYHSAPPALSLPLYPIPLSSSCSLFPSVPLSSSCLSLCTLYCSPQPVSSSVPQTSLLLLLSLPPYASIL